MAETRSIVLSRVIANGYPMVGEVEGFTPVEVKKIMEAAKGGRFVAGEVAVGVEVMKFSLSIVGVTDEMLRTFEVDADSYSEITVLASTIDEQKNKVGLRWEHTCEVTSIKTDEVKPGVYKKTLEFTCRAFKHTDNGSVIHDIDIPTQKVVVFGVDLMEPHRANTEM